MVWPKRLNPFSARSFSSVLATKTTSNLLNSSGSYDSNICHKYEPLADANVGTEPLDRIPDHDIDVWKTPAPNNGTIVQSLYAANCICQWALLTENPASVPGSTVRNDHWKVRSSHDSFSEPPRVCRRVICSKLKLLFAWVSSFRSNSPLL